MVLMFPSTSYVNAQHMCAVERWLYRPSYSILSGGHLFMRGSQTMDLYLLQHRYGVVIVGLV